MSRTTLDIDDPILLELKKLQQNLGPGLAKFAATNRFVPSTN